MADDSTGSATQVVGVVGVVVVVVVVVVGAGDDGTVVEGMAERRVSDAAAAVLLLGRLQREGNPARAVVLSLAAVSPADLSVVRTIRSYFPGVEVWLSDVGAHAASLAQAVLWGATGLVADGRLHRFAQTPDATPRPVRDTPAPRPPPASDTADDSAQPLLSNAELRALLGDPEEDEE